MLTVSVGVAMLLGLTTAVLAFLPPRRGELRVWRCLGIQHWRRRITKWRNPRHRLNPLATIALARDNLYWHLFLTLLFGLLMAMAIQPSNHWRSRCRR